jgi:serine/threonine-protein kinase
MMLKNAYPLQSPDKRRRTGSTRAPLCLGVLLASGACVPASSASRPRPPVSLPTQCPPGAESNMKRLRLPYSFSAALMSFNTRSLENKWWLVREGEASLWLGPETVEDAEIRGKFYLREGRVHGRFTELRTREGDSYPVCLMLFNVEDEFGMEIEEVLGDTFKVWHFAHLKQVDTFK